jgi:hypothetical protein
MLTSIVFVIIIIQLAGYTATVRIYTKLDNSSLSYGTTMYT